MAIESTFRTSDTPWLDFAIDLGSSSKVWLEKWSAYIFSELSKQDSIAQYHMLQKALSRKTATTLENLNLPEDDQKKVK